MTTEFCTIAGFLARATRVDVGDDPIALWRVADLERHVDRRALLAGDDDAPEPPYWAHLWSGAVVLAAAVPARAGRTIELGCGLGLPGLVAARRGAHVTFLDRAVEPLAFVRASAKANDLGDVTLVAADATSGAVRARFDCILVAELLYDRSAFSALVAALADLLAPAGRILLTDARRIDTRAFYPTLEAAGFTWRARDEKVMEEGFPLTVSLVEAWRSDV